MARKSSRLITARRARKKLCFHVAAVYDRRYFFVGFGLWPNLSSRRLDATTFQMQLVKLARNAMATRFEIVLHGANPVSLRAAGEEALDEIKRLENQLSLFKSSSEIARLNSRAAREAVCVTPTLFALLEHAKKLSGETGGAFDITIAPLMKCWGLMQREGKIPSPEELAEACSKIGMHLVHLNRADFAVRFEREGVMLDLGAIGKGYAIERAAELLREAGVTSALLHGGTSTVQAIGHPPDSEFWKVAIEQPEKKDLLATVPLKDESLSVSAVWGKSFEAEGKTFGHVIDPRCGRPVSSALLAAVVLPSATETDALSTAFLILGASGHEKIHSLRAGMRTLLICEDSNKCLRVESHVIETKFPDEKGASGKMPVETECRKE